MSRRCSGAGLHARPILNPARLAGALALCSGLAACGGGGSGGSASSPTPVPSALSIVSATALLSPSCGLATGSAQDAFTAGSAVQPQLAVGPIPGGLAAASGVAPAYALWEQDRWNAVGARAILFAASSDAGVTWSQALALPFSACGSAASGFDRASDPSIVTAVDSSGHPVLVASALAFSAANFMAAGGLSAVLISRSSDGGASWSTPVAAISDSNPVSASGNYVFNDRDALAADPAAPYVYLAWDRLNTAFSAQPGTSSIPTYFLRSTDGGVTWPASPSIAYDPGAGLQTFNNQPVVLADGSVGILFTVTDGFGYTLEFIRSTDHGLTWPASGSATVVATLAPTSITNPVPGGAPVRDSPGMAQLAVDPVSGTLAAVWEEASFSGGLRNGIALSLSHDNGVSWSAPTQVNSVPGVQAFDPSVRFGQGGRIAITYYDFRDFVAGSSSVSTGLWLRQSANGVTGWTESRIAGPFDLGLAPGTDQSAGTTGNALFLGDQQGLAWNGISWTAVNSLVQGPGAVVASRRMP